MYKVGRETQLSPGFLAWSVRCHFAEPGKEREILMGEDAEFRFGNLCLDVL